MSGYEDQRELDLYDRVLAGIRQVPGVRAASLSRLALRHRGREHGLSIDGAVNADAQFVFNTTAPGFFETLRLPLLMGRDFALQDGPKAQPVAIVNQNMARTYFANDNPISHRIGIPSEEPGVERYSTQAGFAGTLVRNANAIDSASRTLNVEVDNSLGQLMPVVYAFVHFKIPSKRGALTIPSNALLFRSEGLRVGVVRNSHVALLPVTIGQDYGDTVEVLSRLTARDSVIVNPSDSLANGARVQVEGSPKDGGRQ